MKKSIYSITILALLAACTGSNQKAGNNENNEFQPANTIVVEGYVEKLAEIAYSQCDLAYLIDGELIFHNIEEDKKVVFSEETEDILNFTFDPEGNTLYYNVERDSMLWLKSADISLSKITLQWLINWGLTKENCTTETYGLTSPLFYYKGDLIIRHNFKWDYYDFYSMAIYSIANKNIIQKDFDYDYILKISGGLSYNKAAEYFQTIDENLYYTRNNKKVCLSDKLDFKVLRNKENEDYWEEISFNSFRLSRDETKILYGTMIEMGDLGHGPFSIANKDGSNQMILTKTDISYTTPIWLKNNKIAFIDTENKLFVGDNYKNTIRQIAENVFNYVAR